VYGSREEVTQFLDRIEVGVTYSNRAAGTTTGAWPGYQPFGGWKRLGQYGQGNRPSITWRSICASNPRRLVES
jgi:acyl-CoA reductase-like NAD-dependent aldehyde dehydrogenase